METILINWLKNYVGLLDITLSTEFDELNFDILDEAITVDFVQKQFGVNVNKKDLWFNSVKDLVNAISPGT
jgi:acyl carrier protein